MINGTAKNCPVCHNDNKCGSIAGIPRGTCWCSSEFFPGEIFAIVPPDHLGKSCICKDCLDEFKRRQISTGGP